MTRLALLASAALIAAAPSVAQPQPGTGPVGGTPTRPASRGESLSAHQFLQEIINSDRFQLAAAQLAEQRSNDPHVKQFAQQVISDHAQVTQQMQSLMQQLPPGVTAGLSLGQPGASPGQAAQQAEAQSLDQQHGAMLQRLRSAQGAQFNQLYAQEMVREHQNAVDRIANYAQQGDNPQLKQYASQLLPTERQHLQEAQQLQRQVGQG